MFGKLSERIVNDAVQMGIICKDSVEDYVYGLSAFINTAVNIISALMLGIIVDMLFEIILFLIVFQSLRKFVGGSHSKTALRCYISTFITYGLVLYIIRSYSLDVSTTTICMLISSIIMFIFAPVEAIKKPLDIKERKNFGIIGRILTVLWFLVYDLFQYTFRNEVYGYYALVIAVSVSTVAIFVITGEINLYRHKLTIKKNL